MATLLHLAGQNRLSKLDAALGRDQQEWRRIYALPQARKWMEGVLPTLESELGLEISPIEQLDAFLTNYCAGDTLMYGRQFRPLRHIDAGVWELKTPDLRLFGWFHAKDCFICSDCDDATKVKKHHLYAGYRDQAVRLRDQLDLDEPKFLSGDDPNDVISAFCFPPT